MEEAAKKRPEELLNSFLKLRTGTGNVVSATAVLALLWSTVVHLGSFARELKEKEFWILTVLSFMMAFKLVKLYDNELDKGIYMEEPDMICILRRQQWIHKDYDRLLKIVLYMMSVMKVILFFWIAIVIDFSQFVTLGVSVWRLLQRDYGNAGGDAVNRAKLNAALDIFYALVLFQSVCVFCWKGLDMVSIDLVWRLAPLMKKQCGFEKWGSNLVRMYYSETQMKLSKEGKLPNKWNFITYGVELLQSPTGDDHLWGARLLDKLVHKDKSVRQELLSSRSSIQTLIGMIGLRGTDNIENRERAARIVAHLASDLNVTHFPGTVQCISSLLGSSREYCDSKVTCPSENPNGQILPDKKDQHGTLQTSQPQDDGLMPKDIENQTDHEHKQVSSSPAGLTTKRKRTIICGLVQACSEGFQRGWMKGKKDREERKEARQEMKKARQEMKKARQEWRRFPYESKGAKELISQGLLILERVTEDNGNCTEISKDQRLLSKIISPLSSHYFLTNLRDDTMVEMLSKSLTVVSRLLTNPGDGATRLRQELASNKEAVSNLMSIMEIDSDVTQQLHQHALEILTELAFDDSFKKLDFKKLFKTLRSVFLEEKHGNPVVAEAERERATRLRGKTGEALARLLPARTARGVNVAEILSKQEAINLMIKVRNEILSSKMGTATDTATGEDSAQPPTQGDEEAAGSAQPPTQGNEEQSEERKLLAAMLSLAVVMCNENVISREDFAHGIHEDGTLEEKLVDILKANKHSTSECLRVVKLTCQVVIAMVQVKPSCINHFNGHNLRGTLADALKTMSEVDDCMLFVGNDREVIKPERSLASLVKEAQELLDKAQEQGITDISA
ncbi:unnamed protein product [Urochloa decumbens]|uniref:Uncharacterized protein n=1 Tax=Urochloa decumbens TaxID=240449 RepID=A0ABC9GDD6_9POAL